MDVPSFTTEDQVRTSHYEIVLQIPHKGADPESKRFRIIHESHYATGRHDVHTGRMVVIDGGQWFLDMGSVPYGQVLIPTYRTNRQPRHEHFLGRWVDNVEIVDRNSPFAQAFIKGLYFFGEFTNAVRTEMLNRAQNDWLTSSRQREHEAELSYLMDQLRRGSLSRDDVNKVVSEFEASLSADSSAS